MESILVTACINTTACHHHKGECTIKHVEGILQRVYTRKMLVSSLLLDKVGKNLGIRRRLEQASLVFKFLTELMVIHDLTVVGHRKVT